MGKPRAIALTGDPVALARSLERIRDAVLAGGPAPTPPRQVISESWRRSLAADVDPDSHPPTPVYNIDELADIRDRHPLAAVLPLLRSTLVSVADEAFHVMIVTDAEGNILWREGSPVVQRRADQVGLYEGTCWSETSMGTNAMGTTLAVDSPVQVHSAEHLVHTYHNWTCAAAPVHDPDTGVILGAIDVTGPLHTMHPALVALVTATAQLAEGQLRTKILAADERLRATYLPQLTQLGSEFGALLTPTGRVLAAQPDDRWPERIDVASKQVELADGSPALVEPLPQGYLLRPPRPARRRSRLHLRLLAGNHPTAHLNERPVALTTRRAELLALLALHPEGLTAEELALHIYGEDGNPTTVRAEIHRLRDRVGGVVGVKPYRLRAEIDLDLHTVRAALHSGRLDTALRLCRGELLPQSESPTLRAEWDELLVTLRHAVLHQGEIGPLWSF
ncbi:MAG: GAF domain-containing protein, partial [Pseudonocardiales bacterium]|nr:GAF domain-containing protein [Pseudonocardiales bacterium]